MSLKPFRRGSTGPDLLFVKADWCGHCKAAKPELAKAAAVLGSVLPVRVVDSEKNKDFIATLGVEGFPTIIFRNAAGRMKTYNGERTGRKIADWACAQSGGC